MRSLLAISFNQKPKNLFCKSVNLESHLAIPFNRLLDVVLPDGRVWKLLSSLFVVLKSTQWFFLHLQFCWNALRSPPVMIQKTYMQWFMVWCHACICTWFWNIGPIIFFYFMKLSLDMSLLLKSYAGFISRAASVLPIISLRRSLRLFTSSLFFQNVWLVIAFFVMLLSNALTYLFQIYGLSKRFKKT